MVTNLFALGVLLAVPSMQPPSTPKEPVADEYHGVKVVDDFRWLEDWSSPRVKQWSDQQNDYTRATLDALPGVDDVRARMAALLSATSASYGSPAWTKGRLLAIKSQPPKQQSFLVSMPGPMHADQERVILDPNVMDPEGGTTIDWFVPSPDGTMVAVSLSEHGSEAGNVHVYDLATGKKVHETIERVQGGTAGGDLAWAPDSRGFYYTRYPREGERPAADMHFYVQVYFHALGEDPAKDRYEVGKDFPRVAEIVLECLDSGPMAGTVLASVQKGDGGEFMHFVRNDGAWRRITRYEDRVVQAVMTPQGSVVMVSYKDAPRGKVLMMTLDEPRIAAAREIIPQGEHAVVNEFFEASNLLATSDTLYVSYQTGGPSVVRAFGYDGAERWAISGGEVAAVHGLTALDNGQVLLSVASYVEPLRWMVHDGKDQSLSPTPLSSQYPFSFADYEVVREMATSKDGTKVPLNITRKKGIKLDGSHPCLVTGYGGYGVNIEPRFRAGTLALLEQGFVFAEANIRGGGEFGDLWHKQGNLTHKQNVFDDFAAAVEHMHKAGYSTPQRTAVTGGSNGGLLMAALFTQRPELAKCVVSRVGIYDMLRVELSANGEFNIPEFGTVKDPAQFKALHAYSPYHHVKEGVKYPPVLFMTGANDPRVDPMQSRKMTAKLQSVGATALLRTSSNSGHGAGTALSEQIEQSVDVNAFYFHHLGVSYRPVK